MPHNPSASRLARPAEKRTNTKERSDRNYQADLTVADPVRRRHLIDALQAGSDLRRRRCRELVDQYLAYGRADSKHITHFLMHRDETGKEATDRVMAERGGRRG